VTIWVDAQLSPRLATWLRATLNVDAIHVRDLGLREATDSAIFKRAREATVAVLTKDSDFVALLEHHGPPPQILWVTTGNTTEAHLEQVLREVWPRIEALLAAGESLIEIADKR